MIYKKETQIYEQRKTEIEKDIKTVWKTVFRETDIICLKKLKKRRKTYSI